MSTDSRLPYVHLINKCVALSSIQEAKDRCRYTRLYSQTMLNNQLLRDYPLRKRSQLCQRKKKRIKKSLKIPNGQSESVNGRRT